MADDALTSTRPDTVDDPPGTTRPDADRPRLPSLTGLRFAGAALVFFVHVSFGTTFNPEARGTLFDIFKTGTCAVAFFFILSGFVLTWAARPGDPVGLFWRRRVFKVFPNHLITFALALAGLLATGIATGVLAPILNLLLLHAWVPNVAYTVSVNPVAWSLSCEVLFYFSFPLLIIGVNKIRRERLWFYATGLVLLIWCVPLIGGLVLPTGPNLPFAPVTQWEFWFIYTFPPVRALEFVLGMVMARIVLTKSWINLPLAPAFVIAVACYVGSSFVPYEFGLVATMIIPLALLIASAAAADISAAPSLLRSKAMTFLGDNSYAMYVWHYLILKYLHNLLSSGDLLGRPVPRDFGTGIPEVLLIFVVTLVVAWLQFRFIERPIMRRWSEPAELRRRRAALRRHAATSAAADGSRSPEPV